MNEVLHANIFFVIASIATVVFFIIICFVLYQVYKIVRVIRTILERVDATSEMVANEVVEFRSTLKNGGFFGRILSIIFNAKRGRKGRTRSRE